MQCDSSARLPTQPLGEKSACFYFDQPNSISIDDPQTTAGQIELVNLSRYPMAPPITGIGALIPGQKLSGCVNLAGDEPKRLIIMFTDLGEREPALPVVQDCTLSYFVPRFDMQMGTGEIIQEIGAKVRDVWHRRAPVSSTEVGAALLDVPACLQSARSRAGLPVQDLAAMFGIKRRQFYNLLSSEQETEPERVHRIAVVADAIARVSGWVDGNTRKVRALLLARLDGDSIYDAAADDDESRLSAAIERAYSAAAGGVRLPQRSAPSNRATTAEVSAVSEYLRATSDQSGPAST
jgi:hypothetical protein